MNGKITEIVGRIPAGELPAHLNLDEQANFALGYYHQRQANFAKPPSADAANTDPVAKETETND